MFYDKKWKHSCLVPNNIERQLDYAIFQNSLPALEKVVRLAASPSRDLSQLFSRLAARALQLIESTSQGACHKLSQTGSDNWLPESDNLCAFLGISEAMAKISIDEGNIAMNGVQICLTKEQVDRINAWIGETPFAHYKEESIPPGFDLVVSFAGPFGAYAVAREGTQELDVGSVDVIPYSGGWFL